MGLEGEKRVVNKLDFGEGTLSFWVPEGAIDYDDNKFIYFINHNTNEGYLKIIKDKDNGLKVFYDYFDNGRCNLNTSVAELDNDDKHHVAVTWSLKERMIKLFIDGQERDSCDIEITP